jgi:cupin superfamily acireductone dioxygenase involved in methionine salvage
MTDSRNLDAVRRYEGEETWASRQTGTRPNAKGEKVEDKNLVIDDR